MPRREPLFAGRDAAEMRVGEDRSWPPARERVLRQLGEEVDDDPRGTASSTASRTLRKSRATSVATGMVTNVPYCISGQTTE